MMKNTIDVLPDDILETDVYDGHILLINKGTKLTRRMINKLKTRDIKEVMITDEASWQLETVTPLPAIRDEKDNHDNIGRNTFFQALSIVGHESRYGKIPNDDKDIQFLMDIFVDLHKNYRSMSILHALKSWDHYTFIHSFDVFILGTLLAKKLSIPQLETLSLGFLFHDIGKIRSAQELLHKEGKLTLSEFESIKKHTIEGEKILNDLGQHQIAYFARSHHERIDGSDYPDQLIRKDLSIELRILHIIDVYSALTLKRPYKQALPAQDALHTLIQHVKKYDESILYTFIEALGIYPSHSTVLLSDHTAAIINQVNKYIPILPDIKRLDKEEATSLPLDFSLTVSKMINAPSKTWEAQYLDFFNRLIEGNKEASNELFFSLIDELKLEEIYTKIFFPVYRKIVKLAENHKLPKPGYHQGVNGLIDLLDQMEQEMKALNEYKFHTLFIVEGSTLPSVPLKIALGLLHIEYIFPIMIHPPVSEGEWEQVIAAHNVKSVCIIHSHDTAKQEYNHLQSEKMDITYKSYDELDLLLHDISRIEKQELDFFKRLFDLICNTGHTQF